MQLRQSNTDDSLNDAIIRCLQLGLNGKARPLFPDVTYFEVSFTVSKNSPISFKLESLQSQIQNIIRLRAQYGARKLAIHWLEPIEYKCELHFDPILPDGAVCFTFIADCAATGRHQPRKWVEEKYWTPVKRLISYY